MLETRYTGEKAKYRVWTPDRMPRIPDDFLDTAVYLYDSKVSAEDGERTGGCGFLVGWQSDDAPITHVYAVTCNHVINDPVKNNPVIRLNTKRGDFAVIDREPSDWFCDPGGADIAITWIELSVNFRYKTINPDCFLTQQTVDDFAIGPGDECFSVGRFVNVDGKQRNTPVVRFGNIAMLPTEPVRGNDGVPRESFLVEMRSRSGYSGSSVFVEIGNPARSMGREPELLEISRDKARFRWMLGVQWGQVSIYDEEVKERIGSSMLGVTPAWCLFDLLFKDVDVVKQREQIERVARGRQGIEQESALKSAPPTKADNPDHREDFNSLLDAATSGNKPSSGK